MKLLLTTLALALLLGAPRRGHCAAAAVAAVKEAAPQPAALKAAAPAPAAAPAEARASTAAAISPSTIYTAERLRDPFLFAAGGAGSSGGKPFSPDDFNIHNLGLRGLMKDAAIDYALFSDNAFGVTFILRRGKLYDARNKVVAGVTGAMNVKQKSARLVTTEGDVQIFHLGADEKDGE